MNYQTPESENPGKNSSNKHDGVIKNFRTRFNVIGDTDEIVSRRWKIIAGLLIADALLAGALGIQLKHKSDEQKAKAYNEFFQTDKTIHYVTDFEPLNATDIAKGMGALDVNRVAKEITQEIGSIITPGEMIVIPNDQLKTPDHKRF